LNNDPGIWNKETHFSGGIESKKHLLPIGPKNARKRSGLYAYISVDQVLDMPGRQEIVRETQGYAADVVQFFHQFRRDFEFQAL
jgi:hypothetical protein